MKIDVQPFPRGSIRTWTISWTACAHARNRTFRHGSAIRRWRRSAMGVQAYRQNEVLFFDRRRQKVSNRPVST